MIDFLRKKHAVPTWILLVILIIITAFYNMGFRITYAPWMENAWGAIDAVGTWVAAIISGTAIWFAVITPKRIADKQDKIALFEKRYAFYEALTACTSFSSILQMCEKSEEFEILFISRFTSYSDEKPPVGSAEFYESKYGLFQSTFNTLRQGKFLFDFDAESDIMRLYRILILFIYDRVEENNFKDYRDEYIETAKKLDKEVVPLVEKTLKLSYMK